MKQWGDAVSSQGLQCHRWGPCRGWCQMNKQPFYCRIARMLIIFLHKKKKMTQPFSQRVLGAVCLWSRAWKWLTRRRPQYLIMITRDSVQIQRIQTNRTAERFPSDRWVNTYLHALLLNPSPHLPVQVPGVCLWSHTDLQLFCSLTRPPATWRGLQWRWQWGSDPSTPERLGRTASASFRCRETPQVSKSELSGLQMCLRWCGYKS